VRRRPLADESGQTFSEFAVIVGGIAMVCLLAVLFIGGGVADLFGSTAGPLAPGAHQPPNPSELPYPTTADECVDEGWQNFPQFEDEIACLDFVGGLEP
jgi:Flp pilus assembly pilin Flp